MDNKILTAEELITIRDTHCEDCTCEDCYDRKHIRQLLAHIAGLTSVLRECEWAAEDLENYGNTAHPKCPICGNKRDKWMCIEGGHAGNCELAAIIAASGEVTNGE